MKEGLQQIVTALRDQLGVEDRIHLYTNKPCTKIEFEDYKTKVRMLFLLSNACFNLLPSTLKNCVPVFLTLNEKCYFMG